MVSKKDLHSAELETMRTSRSPTTVMTANGEVQTGEEATVHVKQLDLFKKLPKCFHWGNSARNMSLEKRSKIHISSKMTRELIAMCQTMNHLWFLECGRVLPQLRLHLPRHHLHHRIPYLMSTNTPKIQHLKEVEVLRADPLHEPKTKKWRIGRSTKRCIV